MACATLPSAAAAERGADRPGDIRRRERPQQQPPAARTDGGQQAAGRMADDQEQAAPRRFLQELEQRIGAGRVQLVGGVDHHHPPSGLARGRAKERYQPAHILDRDDGAQRAALARPALEHQEVGMPLGGDQAGCPVIRR
jgi:hypothetical protein